MTWSYFSRRCFSVNRKKVAALVDMSESGNIAAELRFGVGVLLALVPALLAAVTGRPERLLRALVAVAGVVLAGCGYVTGRVQLARGRRPEILTTGLSEIDVRRARVCRSGDRQCITSSSGPGRRRRRRSSPSPTTRPSRYRRRHRRTAGRRHGGSRGTDERTAAGTVGQRRSRTRLRAAGGARRVSTSRKTRLRVEPHVRRPRPAARARHARPRKPCGGVGRRRRVLDGLGAQIMPFSRATFDHWPFGWDEIEPHYRAVLAEVPLAAEDDDYAEHFPLLSARGPLPPVSGRTGRRARPLSTSSDAIRAKGIVVGKARLAFAANSCMRCGLCMTGCPYSLIYSARQTIDRFVSTWSGAPHFARVGHCGRAAGWLTPVSKKR